MTHEGLFSMEKEQSLEEYRPIFIGRLKDLGLGNPEGIPSKLAGSSQQELEDYADILIQQLEIPTESNSFSCIDGREILATASDTESKIRLRRVGGSASNYGVALNAGIDVPDARTADELSGTERSAHSAGCGGANGEVEDNQSIAESNTLRSAAKALLGLPKISEFFDATYDSDSADIVAQNAYITAQRQSSEGWNGQAYVDEVAEQVPENVDKLWNDPKDKFHGHAESAVVIILGDRTLRHGNFVWNLGASKRAIDGFVENGGDRTKLTIAEVLKHLAVADRLPSEDTPLIVLSSAA